MSQPVVAEGVSVKFGGRFALRDVGLRLDVGVTALMGANGAGKTTLIEVLSGLRQPTRGQVLLHGAPMSGRQRRTLRGSVGVLPQNLSYLPRFSAREFVRYVAWLKKVPASRVDDRVSAVLESVGMQDRADDPLRSLSGGMIRRVGLAQAIVNEPELLLLDEPTVGLDPEQRVRLRELVRLLGQRTTVLLSTHLAEDVAQLADQVCVLQGGQVTFHGDPATLGGVARRESVTAASIEEAYSRLGSGAE